ncbi:MAG TPA: DMT family transporter [Caulobacteraceae bacterium]|nr:DMT family transporter [Caulobacteraceae bacterium]
MSVSTAQHPPAAGAQPDRRAAMAGLIAGALVISLAPILVRLSSTGEAATGFWRLVFAAPLLALMSLRGAAAPLGRPSRFMIAAGLAFALDLACWHYGIRFTSVANATVLPNLTPVIVTVGAWMFLRETPTRVFVVGMAVSVAGAVVMALANAGAAATGPRPHLGDALSASTALWYALYFLAVRRSRAEAGATPVMFWSSVAAAPVLLVIAVVLGEQVWPQTALAWAPLVGLGIMHVAGQGAIAWSLGRLPAATAALVALIQPVAAAIIAYFLFGETLSPWQTVGGALALGGVVLAQLKSRAA